MDSVHHIWCPLFSQEFQDLPDGAETTLTIEAERPVPERYLTADTEGFRVLCERFWLFGSCIESHRKLLGAL